MTAIILDGRKVRDELIPKLIKRVKALSYTPKLAIIQVGDRPDSTSFIKAKKSFAKKIGIDSEHIQVPDSISQEDLLDVIHKCNNDETVKGIIVQLPLPLNLDRDMIIDAILPEKDVDALTATNVKYWLEGRKDALFPATARGVLTLLNKYNISLYNKKVTVIGRSMLVGKPIIAMCLNENAIVSVCHSKTSNLEEYTNKADIIIVAVGKPGLIVNKHVNKVQTIIDVGINTVIGEELGDGIDGKRLVGDVDFDGVKDIVSAITPVPGGVGPMTVVSLFENLIDLCGRM